MSLDAKFRAEIEKTLNNYERDNTVIDIEEAQTIYALRQMLINITSILKLRQELTEVTEGMTGHFFSFLPFVSDLKKELHNLLMAPDYSLVKLFTAESASLREENEQLRKKLQIIEQQPHDLTISQPPIKDVELYQKIAALEKEFTQTHQMLRLENLQIVQQLQSTQQECSSLQTIQKKLQARAESAEAKVEMLQIAMLEKDTELERLRAENVALKKACGAKSGPENNSSTKPSSYSILYQH